MKAFPLVLRPRHPRLEKMTMDKQQELDVTEPQPPSYPFKFTLQLEAQDQTVEISGRLGENAKNELINLILEARSVQT
jgi:hypothetical protein